MILVFLIAINLAALATFWFSRESSEDPHGAHRGPRADRPMRELREQAFERMMEQKLDLDKEQSAALRELRHDHLMGMRDLAEEMDEARRNIELELSNKSIDTALLRALNSRASSLDSLMRNQVLDLNLQIRSLLDQEQLDTYLQIREEMGKRRRRGRNPYLTVFP